MSAVDPRLTERVGWGHPSVRGWGARERLLAGMGALLSMVIALAISVAIPHPSVEAVVVVVGVTLGVIGVVALMVSTRYEVSLALLVLYLGLLDGPIKLESPSHHVGSGIRDVLIIAIGLGMLMRLPLKRGRVALPPLSGWVLAFVAVVLVEALNPATANILKSIGGYRQELEWVPCFFFGYLIMRDKRRFRKFFLLLGAIALANGIVGTYQARLAPSQMASWGPGYSVLAGGGEHLRGRTYAVEGVGHIRPPALGSDAGFGGGIGVLALPGLIALLVAGRLRRRWPVLLCCVGALLGITTSASRTSTIIGVLILVIFGLLSLVARLRTSRALAGLIVVVVATFVVGSLLVATSGSSIFHRQETLTSLERAEETGGEGKQQKLSEIPTDLIHAPLGVGLGTAAAASGFGGTQHPTIEGEKVAAGSVYGVLMREVGFPGLFLWVGFSINAIVLAMRGLRRVRDPELRTYLVAMLTAFIAFTIEGLSSPTLAVTVGAALWFVPGVIAYWFAGPGRNAMRSSRVGTP